MAHEPLISFHLKLVAKVGISLSVLSTVAIIIVLTLLSSGSNDSYESIIRSNSLTRQQLDRALLLAGLLLVAITGLMTWLIVLYSSFRVAGPLFRFSQNLKIARESNSIELIELRKNDALAEQATDVKQAVASFRMHRAETKLAADEAMLALTAGNAAQYAQAIARLKMLDEKVRI